MCKTVLFFCFFNYSIACSTHPQRVQSRHTEYPEPVFLKREKRLTLRLIGIKWKKKKKKVQRGCTTAANKALNPLPRACAKQWALNSRFWLHRSGLVWLLPLSPHLTGAAHGAQCGAPLGGHREMTLALLPAHWLKRAAPPPILERRCGAQWTNAPVSLTPAAAAAAVGNLSCVGNLKCLKTIKWANLPLLPWPIGGT